MANTPNQYKFFRGVNNAIGPVDFTYGTVDQRINYLDKRYDEPTYATFRVLFGQKSRHFNGVLLTNTDYDRMPMPLFMPDQVDAQQRSGDSGRNVVEFNRDVYSTIDYLRDGNEFTRAEMLKEFITLWNDLQDNYQWYFQVVEGLADLLRVVPERGQRVGKDVRLTFRMLEGIDQRVSYLLNLYRKIAWDDTYQRWVLPDMMRFFDVQLYITEFRTFHQSMVSPKSDEPVYLQVLNGILPTYLIECQMCEFDINSFNFSYRDLLSAAGEGGMNPVNVEFKIKIGNVNEVLTYPLFTHFIMDDYRLNGLERSKEKGLTKDINGRVTNATDTVGGVEIPREEDYASTRSGDLRYADMDQKAQGDTYFQENHVSGTPYNQQTNKQLFFGERMGPGAYLVQSQRGEETTSPDPMDPATWVGNAITFGKSFAVNFVTSAANKGKMMKIPGLGFSFNQAVAAIESKDFNQVFGLIRRAIVEAQSGTNAPSSKLNEKIDNTFKQFLIGVAQSEATDNDQLEFIRAANQILSNQGQWEAVKDLSYATDLRGPQEMNIPVRVEGQGEYKNIVERAIEPAVNDYSWATDRDLEHTGYVMEGTPSSATNGRNLQDETLQQTDILSTATGANLNDKGPNTDIISESTDGDPIKGSQQYTSNISESTDGDSIKGDLYKTDVISKATIKSEVKGDQLTTSIISESTDDDLIRGNLSKTLIISEATDKDFVKGGLQKSDILSEATNDMIKGDMQTTDQLSEATRDRKHADKVVGDMQKTKILSEATNDTLSGKKIGPSSEATDGDPVSGNMMKTNILSEATDGDVVKEKLNQPNPSQATRNKIDNA